jgi:pyruvate kinase
MRESKMKIRKAEEKDIPRLLALLGQVLQIHAEIRPDVFVSGTTKYTACELAGLLKQALPEFLPLVDEVVIARGDLGNAMPLWELPRCQKQLSAVCRSAGVPFMVVTQMLDSMCSRAVPTRAEVSDIYNAVSDGASSVMLTGETAAGQYPVEAMEYLVRTARTALE